VATSSGGDYDTRARLLSRHFGRHIPENPNVVVQNMPGGGGLLATNYIYKIAPRDGTIIGSIDQLAPLAQAFHDKGVEYDLLKGFYIGNTTSSPIVLASWHTSKVKTFTDALTTPLVIGATGAGSANTQVPMMINSLLGTKFKVVTGYPGGNELYLAMERGEIEGRASQSWAGWKSQKPDWLANKKINLLAQAGSRPNPELSDVPLLRSFAKTAEDRAILDLYFNTMEISRPFWVGPVTPVQRVEALRRAFDATMKDEQFLGEARKMNIDIEPTAGEQLQDAVSRIVNAPETVLARAGAYASAK
jgi:tripartite-type tricarboxylate transporter receptor subunit TctC